VLTIIYRFGEYCSCRIHIHAEDGNCSCCRNIGQFSKFDAARPRKPELHLEEFVSYFCVMVLPYILMARRKHMKFIFTPHHLPESDEVFIFLFITVLNYHRPYRPEADI
jgi:hypothetical protein